MASLKLPEASVTPEPEATSSGSQQPWIDPDQRTNPVQQCQ